MFSLSLSLSPLWSLPPCPQVITEPQTGLPVLYSNLSPAIYFIRDGIYMLMLLSPLIPLSTAHYLKKLWEFNSGSFGFTFSEWSSMSFSLQLYLHISFLLIILYMEAYKHSILYIW